MRRFRQAALFLFAAGAALCFSCATGGGAPRWVSEPGREWPEREWLCVVESASTKEGAQARADTALARLFRTDIRSVTTAVERVSQSLSEKEGAFFSAEEFRQQIDQTSDVAGLVGLRHEFWTEQKPSGVEVYAAAFMNRREGAARYAALIRENDRAISVLVEDARSVPATFEAYETLRVACDLATLTDNYRNILSVLAPELPVSVVYGSLPLLEAQAREAAHAIVISVQVRGDENGRLAKAFGEVFSGRAFRSAAEAPAGADGAYYVLEAALTLEDVLLPNNTNVFVRYVLTASLKNGRTGEEVFSFTSNRREGHTNKSEARQRAIRSAEKAVQEDEFAPAFDAYLTSLLP